MADREAEKRARNVLLVGAGERPREVGAVLAALSRLGVENGEKTIEPLSPVGHQGIADLEELLAQRPDEGMLILESSRVPGEDIGFVRRFLERHAHWRLIVLGEEAQDPRVRSLLALPRAQWLPWPPDLEQLRALLSPAGPGRAREDRSPRRAPRRPHATEDERGPSRGAAGNVDVGGLLEELLAGAALQQEDPPRYQFRRTEPLLLQRERGLLLEGLSGLLELARRCAGPDGLVRAAADPAGDAVRIGIDFPLAGLHEKDLPSLFEPIAPDPDADLGHDPGLAEGVAAARHSVLVLRAAGGRVELVPEEPGRVRCEVHIGAAQPERPRAGARTPKPEDPFA